MQIIKKLWGHEEVLVNEPLYCLKRLVLKAGFQCSLHYHKVKTETFVIERGHCFLDVGTERLHLSEGQARLIPPGTHHRFGSWLIGASILEVSTHHEDADVVRLQPSSRLYEPTHKDGQAPRRNRIGNPR